MIVNLEHGIERDAPQTVCIGNVSLVTFSNVSVRHGRYTHKTKGICNLSREYANTLIVLGMGTIVPERHKIRFKD